MTASLLHKPIAEKSRVDLPDVAYAGRCPVDGHILAIGPTGRAVNEAVALRQHLDDSVDASDGQSTTHLRQPAAGKMFGVMECQRADGTIGILRAFSGEWDDTWQTPDGWCPSPGNLEEYADDRRQTEAAVAELTRRIAELMPLAETRADRRYIEERKIERGNLSRALTDRIHTAYRFTNLLGEELQLTDVQTGSKRPPTGMGDCCAPKLLQTAIRLGVQPLGMVEFWWGSPSQMHPRQEGQYYSACREKCYPILGFLLRGVEAAQVTDA